MKRILNLKYISLCILLVLTALSYHPRFSSFVTEDEVANPLNRYILLMTFITFGLNFIGSKWRDQTFVFTFAKWLSVIAIVGGILMLVGLSTSYLFEARNILMAFVFLLIGYNSKVSQTQLVVLILIYSLAVLFSVFYQIISNFGGFVIADLYLQYGKNTLGVMTASSSVALLFLGLHSDKKYIKILGCGLFVVLLFFTITIRARAAFLSIFLLSAFIVYRNIKDRDAGTTHIIGLVCIAFILLVVASLFPARVANMWDYILSSFTQNQGSDLTSGRMSRNVFALNLIAEAPLFGNLTLGYKYEWIHNYVLRQTSSYGLLGSLPIMILYFYIVTFVYKQIRFNRLNLKYVGFVVFVIPLIISLEEPTFPFAPGTGVIFPFVLLGISLANQKIDESMINC